MVMETVIIYVNIFYKLKTAMCHPVI